MRVLVACEFSGVVRDAFRARGHDAWSCDLLPTEADPQGHIRSDVLSVLPWGWDLMIAHPPCTHLAVSGARWFADKRVEQEAALTFVRSLLDAPIPRIALENPVSIISTRIRKPDQIVQPWMFGHPESKATCLWLKGLPKLEPTDILPVPERGRWENQTTSGQNRLPPSPTRWRDRSRTYAGIAEAMADQWGESVPASAGTPCAVAAIAFDFALTDGPQRADLAGTEPPIADLMAQRRGRQPQTGGGLPERRHLADPPRAGRGFEDGL